MTDQAAPTAINPDSSDRLVGLMGFDARAKIKILDACERLLAQESWHGAGQQEGDDRENDHDFDDRETF